MNLHTSTSFVFGLLFLIALPALAYELPDSARSAGAFEDGNPRVEAQLLFGKQAALGEELEVGVLFQIDPDWHIYWRNSGESGLETSIRFGEKAGPLQWEAPHVFLDPSGTIATFGYSHETLIWSKTQRTNGDSLDVGVNFLACKVECIPGRLELKRSWDSEVSQVEAAVFDTYRSKAAKTAEELSLKVDLEIFPSALRSGEESDATLNILCEDCALELADGVPRYLFIPDTKQDVEWRTQKSHAQNNSLSLQLRGRANPDGFGESCVLAGVVHLLKDGVPEVLAVSAPMACGDHIAEDLPTKAPVDKQEESLFFILLFAFLGGLILNLMPCVFPVLAIKVAAFVELASHDQRSIVSHDIAFTAGTVGAMGSLGGLAIGLRSAGTAVGWGFQFQEPWFLLALAVLIVLFSLNLFGVFALTFALGGQREETRTLWSSVGEGVLAVVLATPCSAPLLGTAVGFALAADALVVMAVFLTIGLGLATPFVVLTLIPGARALLPKPGNWMIYFKQLMGFLLLATAIWVVWILGRSVSNNSLGMALSYILVASFGAWVFGASQYGKWRWFGRVALLLTLLSGPLFLELESQEKIAEKSEIWSPWSAEAVEVGRKEGRPVFVDFTADWCITCKVNENGVLASDDILRAFSDANTVMLKGDWTQRDELIRAELARHGKAGVPLYLMISTQGEVQVLPELLTPQMVLDGLKVASRKQLR